MKINLLPQHLINQISAGEVIERPASVVKELVENSIDAGATKIEISIKNGGLSEIVIIDNGSGIEESEIENAFTKHATSKIQSAEDLFKIQTLGFRGEALSSISSIAKVYIDTRVDKSEIAITARIVNGKLEDKNFSNRQVGTTLVIQDIFYNIPARKKFLKSTLSEKNHIMTEFYNIVLCHKDIEFTILVDEKQIHKLLPVNDLKLRIDEIFGSEIGEFLHFDEGTDSTIKLSGYISHPNSVTSKKGLEYIFVNGRAVKDALVRKAVTTSYNGFVPNGFHPQFFIYLEVNPNLVDVNVHPKKMEVRWEDTNTIFSRVHHTIKNIIEKSLRSSVRESMDERFADNEINISEIERVPIQFPIDIPNSNRKDFSTPTERNLSGLNSSSFKPVSRQQTEDYLNFGKELFDNKHSSNLENNLVEETVSVYNSDNLQTETSQPNYKKSFSFFDTYILLEYTDKIQIIDQHAAAERITYDKLQNKFRENKSFEAQELLIPISLLLNNRQKEILKTKSILEFFEKFSIQIAEFGKDDFVISSHPLELSSSQIDKLVIEILDEVIESGEEYSNFLKIEKNIEKILASSACHNSIRAGYDMDNAEIDWLMKELFATKNPYSCPHGRPIIWNLTKSTLEKQFGRVK